MQSESSTFDLLKAASRFGIQLINVFMRDQIPRIDELQTGGYIINLEDSKNDGTHWTCFYVPDNAHRNKKNTILYFDSFGMEPPQEFIAALQHRWGTSNRVVINRKIIQNPNSGWCGLYCLYFIYYCQTARYRRGMVPSAMMRDFCSRWSSDPEDNLKLLHKYITGIDHKTDSKRIS